MSADSHTHCVCVNVHYAITVVFMHCFSFHCTESLLVYKLPPIPIARPVYIYSFQYLVAVC